MRPAIASVVALFLGSIWPHAQAAEFNILDRQPNPNGYANAPFFKIEMTGPIAEGDADRLRAVLKSIEDQGLNIFNSVTLLLDSKGGQLEPSLQLVALVRERGLKTVLEEGATCLSGCALVFMAGSYLDGDGVIDPYRFMHPRATLGFHAPYSFRKKQKVDPEVAGLLLADSERGGVLAASKLVRLTLSNILPATLVEELLQYESDTFLFIDTVDKAGRWKIALLEQANLPTQSVVTETDKISLSQHCANKVQWLQEQSAFDVVTSNWLSAELKQDGMDDSCEYKAQENDFYFSGLSGAGSESGNVLQWQTLAPTTKLALLSEDQWKSSGKKADPFTNPPPSQVDGPCKDGHQWVGGWSGPYWSEATAHATYRTCGDGAITKTPLRLLCEHGEGKVRFIYDLSSFGGRQPEGNKIATKIDDHWETNFTGRPKAIGGVSFFESELPKDYFTYEHMKAGTQVLVTANGKTTRIHLTGSRKAIEAMQKSCL